MNYTEIHFLHDFKKSSIANVDLKFDLTQLEPNTKSTRHLINPLKINLGILCPTMVLMLLIPFGIYLGASFKVNNSVTTSKKVYSANQIKIAENNSFHALNSVTYPEGTTGPVKNEISTLEKSSYNNFSNLTYHSLVDTSKKDNMSYSVSGLYSVMNELENAVSEETTKTRFNDLLGLSRESRVTFYDKLIRANSFVIDNSTIQIKNGAFITSKYKANDSFISNLTSLYCEAYSVDFETGLDKIVEWTNKAVGSEGYIDTNYLDLKNETVIYLMSTLYFKNAWNSKYLQADNVHDIFNLSDGTTISAEYMKHSYQTKSYYDYGTYVSVKDYYYHSNASITYLIPKSVNDNIFELTKDANIFDEDESKIVVPAVNKFMINLKTPKFNTKCDIDFESCLANLGFADIFNDKIDTFHNAFNNETTQDLIFYIENIKQRNNIEFNEDGSIIKSVNFSPVMGGAMSTGPEQRESLDVNLDQPFIYIIRDVNDNPIFVGHIDNPNA